MTSKAKVAATAKKPRPSGPTLSPARRLERGYVSATLSLPLVANQQITALAERLACTRSEVVLRAVARLAAEVAHARAGVAPKSARRSGQG